LGEGEKMLFKICPNCGANLDPGERCECEESKNKQNESEDVKNKGEEK
jgi:hypothetical protein